MAQAKHLALALFTLFNAVEGRRTQDASQLISDPLTYGPELELVHLYYDEFPTGRLVLSLLELLLTMQALLCRRLVACSRITRPD
jgi:hypothetical protein